MSAYSRTAKLRVSILAWGSIVCDPQNIPGSTGFEPTGPQLPIEFCRISADGRLTLVIAEDLGTPCATYSAVSANSDLDRAIEALRLRERMPSHKGVGFIIPRSRNRSAIAVARHPQAVEAIGSWVSAHGFDAAIWTALESNFEARTGTPFSVEAAIRYLETLDKSAREAALTYIRNAPSEIQTPFREAISGDILGER